MKNYESDKSQSRKVRKQANIGASTEGKVEAAEGSTKRAEKTTMDARKRATEKKFRHLCRTKSIDV